MFKLIGIADLEAIIEAEGVQTLTYNTDGTVNYITLVLRGATYRKTYSYSAGQISSISVWVEIT